MAEPDFLEGMMKRGRAFVEKRLEGEPLMEVYVRYAEVCFPAFRRRLHERSKEVRAAMKRLMVGGRGTPPEGWEKVDSPDEAIAFMTTQRVGQLALSAHAVLGNPEDYRRLMCWIDERIKSGDVMRPVVSLHSVTPKTKRMANLWLERVGEELIAARASSKVEKVGD